MSKNKPNLTEVPKTKTEIRNLECILTPEELKECAETMAHTVQERSEIIAEKKEVMSGFKNRIEKCDSVILNSANALNTGKEEREIECEVELNKPKDGMKTIIRKDNGEQWEEKMSDLELQEEIF